MEDFDPVIPDLDKFEGEFQKFMRGEYTHTLDEEWERQLRTPTIIPGKCPHGKSVLSCPKCYFDK